MYNSAKCQVDVNDEDGLLMGGCLDEETVEGWDGMGNGLDGWVGDMGVLPEEGEVLVVGGFHKTVLETPLQTLCPVFMYRVPEDEFVFCFFEKFFIILILIFFFLFLFFFYFYFFFFKIY